MSQANETSAPPGRALTLSSPGHRIDALDLLRGIAILGIFVMNTWTMSMPQQAYTNPAAYNTSWVPYQGFPSEDGLTFTRLQPPAGSDYWDYVFVHLFADMKFITMFSIMFGAGMVLQSERSRKKDKNPWLIHYLRMFVLLVFGLVHTFGFWYGDILTDYAMSGMILAPFRKIPPFLLMLMGMALISFVTFVDYARTNNIWREDLKVAGITIPYSGLNSLEGWESHVKARYSTTNEYEFPNDHELETYRGTTLKESGASIFEVWISQIKGHRFAASVAAHTTEFVLWTFPRCGGCMLLGMALYRRRFFHGEWTKGAYASIAGIAPFVGWAVILMGINFNTRIAWNDDWYSVFSLWHMGVQFNYWGSLLVTWGYMSFGVLVAMWAANPSFSFLSTLLAPIRAVGRMALTCYLMSSVIGTTIFYGHGFGLFGHLKRVQLLPIVFGTWVFLLVFSTLWLRIFRQGPLEWVWHSLVYWDWRNPRKSAAGPDAVSA